MGDGGFIRNPEWAKRFLTDGESNEITAEFYQQQAQRKEHEKQFETVSYYGAHLVMLNTFGAARLRHASSI